MNAQIILELITPEEVLEKMKDIPNKKGLIVSVIGDNGTVMTHWSTLSIQDLVWISKVQERMLSKHFDQLEKNMRNPEQS